MKNNSKENFVLSKLAKKQDASQRTANCRWSAPLREVILTGSMHPAVVRMPGYNNYCLLSEALLRPSGLLSEALIGQVICYLKH